jgi:hypothetical protein
MTGADSVSVTLFALLGRQRHTRPWVIEAGYPAINVLPREGEGEPEQSTHGLLVEPGSLRLDKVLQPFPSGHGSALVHLSTGSSPQGGRHVVQCGLELLSDIGADLGAVDRSLLSHSAAQGPPGDEPTACAPADDGHANLVNRASHAAYWSR